MDKSNTRWNINLNVHARSMKGILMLFENVAAQQPFACNTEAFYNPKITKVEVTIEGIPNQLYSQGMRAYQMWDEEMKYFAASPAGALNIYLFVVMDAQLNIEDGRFISATD